MRSAANQSSSWTIMMKCWKSKKKIQERKSQEANQAVPSSKEPTWRKAGGSCSPPLNMHEEISPSHCPKTIYPELITPKSLGSWGVCRGHVELWGASVWWWARVWIFVASQKHPETRRLPTRTPKLFNLLSCNRQGFSTVPNDKSFGSLLRYHTYSWCIMGKPTF